MDKARNNLRLLALLVLNNVIHKQKNLKNEFDEISLKLNLEHKSFLKFLIYGILRSKKTLDATISDLYAGKFSNLEFEQKNILRIGIYQIKFMNGVPDYAAVSTSVELAKKNNYKFSKVVNAVLNSFIRNNKLIKNNPEASYDFSKSFIRNLGPYYNPDEINRVCSKLNELPSIWVRVIDTSIIKELEVFSINMFTISKKITYFQIRSINEFIRKNLETKKIIVQSPGSGLAVKLLDIKSNEKVIDTCAAPGGKSHAIIQHFKKNNTLICNEINTKRNNLLTESLLHYKNYNIINTSKDACIKSFPFVNKIFIDVPCSSSGTIQKNPDIKWKKINLDKVNFIQESILGNMSKYLLPGGALVYSTCSIFKSENHDVINKFLSNNKTFKIDHASKFIDKRYVDEMGCLKVCPYKHGFEGIFGVRLVSTIK